jgi:phosphonate transport system ATP-binding protein
MIFQQFNLVPRLDVLTNVLLGRLNHRFGAQHARHVYASPSVPCAIAALERLGIARPRCSRRERFPAASSSAWPLPGP